MKWQPYPGYKPSGVEWLGGIPEDWEIFPVKHLAGNHVDVVQTGPFGAQLHASDYIDEGVPLILIRNVNNSAIDTSDIPMISEEKANTLGMYRLKEGDIVFSRVGSIGRIALITQNETGWLISGQMLRLRINNPILDKNFSVHAFSCDEVLKFVQLQSVGSTRESINTDILRNMPIPIPSLREQRTIAAFLDRETGRIDALMEKKRRQIELLQEKRAALISHAVTKGLDPTAPMKDSGVEWLGEIPSHWNTLECKFGYSIQLDKMLQNEPQTAKDEQVPYLKALYVQWENVNTSDLPEMWASPGDIRKYSVRDGDLLVCEGGEVGRAGILQNPPAKCIIQNALHHVRPRGVNSNRFLMYLLKVASFQGWFDILCNKATIAHFTGEKFACLPIVLPPAHEQRAIAVFLDRGTGRIDAMMGKVRVSIEKLKEYRTALISAAVMGKIDVREEAA